MRKQAIFFINLLVNYYSQKSTFPTFAIFLIFLKIFSDSDVVSPNLLWLGRGVSLSANTTLKSIVSEFDGDNLVAQAAVFFTGGFETSSIVLSFTMYELAVAPDIQTKLRTEIQDALEATDGKITYETVSVQSCSALANFKISVPNNFQFRCPNYSKRYPISRDFTNYFDDFTHLII